MYDTNGNITRAGAEQAIRDGGSVLYKGQLRASVDKLPTEVELAVGDPEATQRALDGLAAQRKSLDEQERKLHEQNAKVAQARKDAEAAQNDRETVEAKAAKNADAAAPDDDAKSRGHARGNK